MESSDSLTSSIPESLRKTFLPFYPGLGPIPQWLGWFPVKAQDPAAGPQGTPLFLE